MRAKRQKVDWAILAPVVIAAVIAMSGVVVAGVAAPTNCPGCTAEAGSSSRLVSVQQLPEDACAWDEAAGSDSHAISPEEKILFSALQQDVSPAQQSSAAPRQQNGGNFVPAQGEREERETAELRGHGAHTPVRTIRDTYPTYSAVAVDVNSNEVILQDNNLWEYQVFDRLSPTPAKDDEISQPKRTVRGDKTQMEFNNGLYLDPGNGDIYSVESDVGDKMVRFPREATGDVSPISVLHTYHRVYNVAADEGKQELYVTVEYPPQVVVFRKQASGEEKPLRHLEGDDTGLDTPHGIAVDEKDRLLFVNNWGHHSNFMIQGTGKFFPPSIKVYSLDASGNAKPLRVITGDKTQLDWPAAMKFNPDNGDLYVANDIGQSVLVFANAPKAQGNIAPARVIRGPSTRLRNPTGVALDLKNKEVWVSNLGNSSATVYPLMAAGDVPPLRVIRSAPESYRGLAFGRTNAVAYDPIREEILVPN